MPLMTTTDIAAPKPYHRPRYQAGLSKQMINESKYKLRGATYKNGITATSWQT